MDAAPVWTDLKSFPWESFRDRVDILTGGYPCQPFSAAGKRAGKEDPRHLWPWIADGIRILRPRMCFFENVEGHISLGLSSVISDLEELGYKVSWGIFSAREVGAPHQRKRVFILAHRNGVRLQQYAAQPDRRHWEDLQEQPQGGCASELAYRHGERGQLPDWWREPAEQVPVGYGETWRDGQWPSRPGEQQFAWEPPRVVGTVPAKLANFCTRDAQQGGDTAQAGSESVGIRGEGEDAMPHGGSSLCGGDQGDEQAGLAHAHGGRGEEPEHQQANLSSEPSGCGSEAVGNADQLLFPAPREHGAMDETSGIPADGKGCEPSQADPIAGATRKREGDGGNASEFSETQSPLGRDADGPAGGLDYAELCVSCDNRTDELRLLGNGVVPATAERAFRILSQQFHLNR
jgi:DNA (cytosine-5)-methyltransferase 1